MSKKYKGKTCVYCGSNPSSTGDHVFAREFFAIERRQDLPQVPACPTCNGKKSELEHYLTTMLLIGGQHADTQSMMLERLPRRLAKNAKLQRAIVEGMRLTVIEEPPPRPGLIPIQVRFDGQKLLDLLAYVARGLLWHHWNVALSPDTVVRTLSLTRSGDAEFARLLGKHARVRTDRDLGNGTFIYTGAQGAHPELSMWAFTVLGGVRLHANSPAASSASTSLAAITGPADIISTPDFAKLLR